MRAQQSTNCDLSNEDLQRFLDGEADDERTVVVAAHLASCQDCRARLAVERNVVSALTSLDRDEVVRWHRFKSPLGDMYAANTRRGLSRITWQKSGPRDFERDLERRYPRLPMVQDRDALRDVEQEMTEFFEGYRQRFTVPVDLDTLSRFQRSVLAETTRIPFGEVVPYAELARRIQRPKAARAVGNALGANPVAIVVPCHRVVASDGSLGGYTGGVECKRRLLAVEGHRDLFAPGSHA